MGHPGAARHIAASKANLKFRLLGNSWGLSSQRLRTMVFEPTSSTSIRKSRTLWPLDGLSQRRSLCRLLRFVMTSTAGQSTGASLSWIASAAAKSGSIGYWDIRVPLVEKVVNLDLQDERELAPSPHTQQTCIQSDGVRPSERAISGGTTRTWNNDRWLIALDPIVRHNIARILNRDVFGCGETRRRGDRLDDPGRVQAFLDVGPGWGAASSCSRGIAKVRPGTRVAASWTAYGGANVSTICLVA